MTFVENLSRLYCIGDKAVRQYEQFCADEGRQSCSNFKALLKYMWDGDFNKVYPDLYTLVKICATVPITSSQCERTHSKVAMVKSAIRSSMSDERLEHLVLLNVEQDIVMKLGLSSLVDSFKLAGPSGSRRLKLWIVNSQQLCRWDNNWPPRSDHMMCIVCCLDDKAEWLIGWSISCNWIFELHEILQSSAYQPTQQQLYSVTC